MTRRGEFWARCVFMRKGNGALREEVYAWYIVAGVFRCLQPCPCLGWTGRCDVVSHGLYFGDFIWEFVHWGAFVLALLWVMCLCANLVVPCVAG